MSLYSLTFLFRFLPLFLAVYYITPAKFRKYVLILGSLLFVGFTDRLAVPAVAGAVLANWALGRLMPRAPRAVLAIGVGCDLGLLLAARYCGLSLPGASFFCFSLLSYLADVYRHAAPAAPLAGLGAYACMFPKLLSGPIARYPALADEIDAPKCTCARLEDGLSLLILGLSYKVLLADPLGGLWSLAGKIGYESLSTPMAWLSALGFSLQLYFDFQGYSLMAIGLGRMLGFSLPRNFDDPYCARSVSEFYRRWHITLGAWFRDYVYIPLGGNRCSRGRTLLNLLIVWVLTGLWHGPTANFVLWGLFLFLCIAAERFWLRPVLERHTLLSHLYVPLATGLSWVMFAITDLSALGTYYARMLGLGGVNVNPADWHTLAASYLPYLAVGIFFALPYAGRFFRAHRNSWFVRIGLFALFWLTVSHLSATAGTPFLYSQF